jgi:methionyl aminopeptidase
MPITIKTKEELALMRQAGKIVALTLDKLSKTVEPGMTTADLDALTEQSIREHGAIPSFKGYGGFPASLCASINEEVVHGIPSPNRVLREGDIVSLDVGAIYEGWQGDAAITVPVGKPSPAAQRLIAVTYESLRRGIAKARKGRRLGDISWAVQSYVESKGFSVVRQYVGHGIGREMHEDPQIPNFGQPGTGPKLAPGMTLALEPMVNVGTHMTVVLPDKWTVVTEDRQLSAHFEHTVAITDGDPWILTAL